MYCCVKDTPVLSGEAVPETVDGGAACTPLQPRCWSSGAAIRCSRPMTHLITRERRLKMSIYCAHATHQGLCKRFTDIILPNLHSSLIVSIIVFVLKEGTETRGNTVIYPSHAGSKWYHQDLESTLLTKMLSSLSARWNPLHVTIQVE